MSLHIHLRISLFDNLETYSKLSLFISNDSNSSKCQEVEEFHLLARGDVKGKLIHAMGDIFDESIARRIHYQQCTLGSQSQPHIFQSQ